MSGDAVNRGAEVVSSPLLDDEKPFDLAKLKVELNNITIMYGPANATIRQAEEAMMAYISVLCRDPSNNGSPQTRG